MAEHFSDIGKAEAIDQLYRLCAYQPVPGLVYTADKGGKVHTAARMYLEGLDFNLVYFPFKHLGYKCVVGVTGELYAALAHPKLLNVILGIPRNWTWTRSRTCGWASPSRRRNTASRL